MLPTGNARTPHLAAQQADALPQRLQHVIKALDAVGRGGLGQRSNGQRGDRLHLLVLIYQACRPGRDDKSRVSIAIRKASSLLFTAPPPACPCEPVLQERVPGEAGLLRDGLSQNQLRPIFTMQSNLPWQTCTKAQVPSAPSLGTTEHRDRQHNNAQPLALLT